MSSSEHDKRNRAQSVEDYLAELEEDELLESASADWLDQQAADFLAKPEVDPTMESILEATKAFTRKNFSLRAGMLYRQQLQNTPDYETVVQLEPALLELAGAANCLAHIQDPHEYAKEESLYNERVIGWALEELAPALEGSEVVKITRSTKKAKNILAQCPPALMARLGIEYQQLLRRHLKPHAINEALVESAPAVEVRQWLAQVTGRAVPPGAVLLGLLWSAKERKQWAFGLIEYAQSLVELVATAQGLDPQLKPRKYLCYYQRKSESTLHRGQEELQAMIANMRADNMLPSLEADLYDNERDSAGWDEDTVQDTRFAMHATGETNETLDPPAVAPAPSAPKVSLRDRLRAKREAAQKGAG